eukprot:728514-Amphidinium_carterae.1
MAAPQASLNPEAKRMLKFHPDVPSLRSARQLWSIGSSVARGVERGSSRVLIFDMGLKLLKSVCT